MRYFAVRSLIAAAMLLSIALPAVSRTDTGADAGLPSRESTGGKQKEKRIRAVDPFIKTMASYFNMNGEELSKLWYRGYGRNELIKDIIISKKAGVELRAIVRERDRSVEFNKIAEKYKIDYGQVMTEAADARRELDRLVAAPAVGVSTPTAVSPETTRSTGTVTK